MAVKKKEDYFKKYHTTQRYLIKTGKRAKYIINGRQYTFVIPPQEESEDIPLAYCITSKKWLHLFDNGICDENMLFIPGEKIE